MNNIRFSSRNVSKTITDRLQYMIDSELRLKILDEIQKMYPNLSNESIIIEDWVNIKVYPDLEN